MTSWTDSNSIYTVKQNHGITPFTQNNDISSIVSSISHFETGHIKHVKQNTMYDQVINISNDTKLENHGVACVLNIFGNADILNHGDSCSISLSNTGTCLNFGNGCTFVISGNTNVINYGNDCQITITGQAKFENSGNECRIITTQQGKLENSGNKCYITYDSIQNIINTGDNCRLHKNVLIKETSRVRYYSDNHGAIGAGSRVIKTNHDILKKAGKLKK